MSDPGISANSWIKSGAVAIILAVTTQLFFTIWWAAHLDQTTLHIIERSNQTEAHVTRLDTVGGLKVNELNSRTAALEKLVDATVSRIERVEASNQQILLIDERTKSLQIQVATAIARVDATSTNATVIGSRLDAIAATLTQQQAQLQDMQRQSVRQDRERERERPGQDTRQLDQPTR